jgi:AcrR family transcriptional regulator
MERQLATKASEPKRRGRPRGFDRETALNAAMTVFWTHGFEGASLADLTHAMGINPPSLYAAFGDKEGLFLEAMERYQAQWRAACPWYEEPTAEAAVRRLLVDCAMAYTAPGKPRGCLIMMGVDTTATSATHVQEALAAKRAQGRNRIRERIEAGIAAGEVAAGTDAGTLANLFMAIVAGMSLQARDGASRKTLLTMAQDAMRAWPRPSAPSRGNDDAAGDEQEGEGVVPLRRLA